MFKNIKSLHRKVVYEDLRRMLETTQSAETHLLKELLLNFTTTHPDMTYW